MIVRTLAWFKLQLTCLIMIHHTIVVLLLNVCYFSVILSLSDLAWPVFGDAHTYADMARGVVVEAPFSYRFIVPWIVSLFSAAFHQWIFLGITIISITMTSILLFDYVRLKGLRLTFSYLAVIVFMGSNVCQYHLLNYGAVDPAFLCLVIAALYLLERKMTLWATPLLIVGFFVKESMLFVIPVFILHALITRDRLSTILITMTGMALSVITLLRPSSYSVASMLEVIEYNGIDLSASLPIIVIDFAITIFFRVLWVYGIVLFSAVVGFAIISRRDKLILIMLLGGSAVMAMFATDWSRMLFLPFPLIILMGLLPFQSKENGSSPKWQRPVIVVVLILVGFWFILGPSIWLFDIDGVLIMYFLLGAFLGLVALIYNLVNSRTFQLRRAVQSSVP